MSGGETAREIRAAFFENGTLQMRKGVLDLCFLMAQSASEWYGYALSDAARAELAALMRRKREVESVTFQPL